MQIRASKKQIYFTFHTANQINSKLQHKKVTWKYLHWIESELAVEILSHFNTIKISYWAHKAKSHFRFALSFSVLLNIRLRPLGSQVQFVFLSPPANCASSLSALFFRSLCLLSGLFRHCRCNSVNWKSRSTFSCRFEQKTKNNFLDHLWSISNSLAK